MSINCVLILLPLQFSKCQLMDVYSKFIGNFMRAKAAIEIAKQARPVFAKFLDVSTQKSHPARLCTCIYYVIMPTHLPFACGMCSTLPQGKEGRLIKVSLVRLRGRSCEVTLLLPCAIYRSMVYFVKFDS